MMKYLFLCLMMVGAANCSAGWANNFDEPFEFTCPDDKFIIYIKSWHNQHYEDRQFKFLCSESLGSNPTCEWHNDLNDFDANFQFSCPDNQYLSGLGSKHDNYYEDRKWKAQCCGVNTVRLTDCWWSYYLNKYDKTLEYLMDFERVTVGFGGVHSNYYEDRRYQLKGCRKEPLKG